MTELSVRVIIPWRDQGRDPRRIANLEVVLGWWWSHNIEPFVWGDSLPKPAPFNRHKAYNDSVRICEDADVYVFTEADMIVPLPQVVSAVEMAYSAPGLVVPFTEYRYLSDETTQKVRQRYNDLSAPAVAEWWSLEASHSSSLFAVPPESVMRNGRSIGAVNVISARTLEMTGGFTEATYGNWYDDNIIEEGFACLAGPTRWVDGPAMHLYHLPGWKGDHLTEEDRAATAHNKALLEEMRLNIRQGRKRKVRELMEVRV